MNLRKYIPTNIKDISTDIPSHIVSSTEYRIKNRESIVNKAREKRNKNKQDHLNKMRHTRLGTCIDGKIVILCGLNKRKYTSVCEVCNKQKNRLEYHHWDNNNYNKGIWVCGRCHRGCEIIDDNLHSKYIELKQRIEKEFKNVS